jgi:hypothetical protein
VALLIWTAIQIIVSVVGFLAWRQLRAFLTNLDMIPTVAEGVKDVQGTQEKQTSAIGALHVRMDKMSRQNQRQEVRTAERFARIETRLNLRPLPPLTEAEEELERAGE